MWAYDSVFYQIYSLGFCNAPRVNDGITVPRIKKVLDWIDYYKELGVDTIFFNPVFESDEHGYDTRCYKKLDCRLGTNDDFKNVCDKLHENGFKIVLDGVFNHVGRGFWAFQDVLKNRENSQYKDWFFIDFWGNNQYNDNLSYEGWEGCLNLVKLNVRNRAVVDYIFSCVKLWYDEFKIDGIRLDVAYCIDNGFLSELRNYCNSLDTELFLVGEVLFGDYNQKVNDQTLHSCTNYECYKGIYSSINDKNLFEISYSLNRQFGADPWTLYKGKHLLSFVDNHDVSRINSILNDKNCVKSAYALMFAMPGIPCIYYGSEWGTLGDKKDGDNSLRPSFELDDINREAEQFEFIKKLIAIRKNSVALRHGGYKNICERNKQLVFLREYNDEKILVAINIENEKVDTGVNFGSYQDLLNKENANLEGNIILDPYEVKFLKVL